MAPQQDHTLGFKPIAINSFDTQGGHLLCTSTMLLACAWLPEFTCTQDDTGEAPPGIGIGKGKDTRETK